MPVPMTRSSALDRSRERSRLTAGASYEGISKAGNRRLRSSLVELAWLWLRYQPDSKLAAWFRSRTGSAGSRMRKVMIVALARKLLVALWRFCRAGVLPEGAALKAT